MHKPTNTKGGRLQLARKTLREDQAALGAVMGCTQEGVSRRENDRIEISYDEAVKLERYKKYRINSRWLLEGEGEMFLSTVPGTAKEPVEKYRLLNETTEEAIRKRFIAAVEYKGKEGEIAENLGISASQWSQVKKGGKQVTVQMLAQAVLAYKVDANFILTKKQTVREDVEQLKEENENLHIVIRALKGQVVSPEDLKKEKLA